MERLHVLYTKCTWPQECGTKFEDEEFSQGGQLCSILYEYEDLKATYEGTNPEGEARERRAAEEELLSMPLVPSFPSHLEATVESLHAGNIIACRINSDGTLIATGGADRAIKIVSGDTYKSARTLRTSRAPLPSSPFPLRSGSLHLSRHAVRALSPPLIIRPAMLCFSIPPPPDAHGHARSRRELRAITAHSAPILSLAWCPTDRSLLARPSSPAPPHLPLLTRPSSSAPPRPLLLA